MEQFPDGQDEGTFRHPLPPGNLPRPRIPIQQVLVRTPLRQISDPRIQGVSYSSLEIRIKKYLTAIS